MDTAWKFRDMFALRDRIAAKTAMTLHIYRNPETQAPGNSPFVHGSQIHMDMWETLGLRQALGYDGFDLAFGGARRDEEKRQGLLIDQDAAMSMEQKIQEGYF